MWTNSNGSDMDTKFASTRRHCCPVKEGDKNLVPVDLVTPNSFDNNYFKNLMQRKGLLDSDQILFSGSSTNNIVLEYSRNPKIFSSDFASAMLKMGDIIDPVVASTGEIKRICNAIN